MKQANANGHGAKSMKASSASSDIVVTFGLDKDDDGNPISSPFLAVAANANGHGTSALALIDGEDDEMKQANANGHGTNSLALIDGEDDEMKQANANGHGTSSLALIDGEDDEMKQANQRPWHQLTGAD